MPEPPKYGIALIALISSAVISNYFFLFQCIQEMFHRQDFFFFSFAYSGDYGALSYKYDNHITIHENECYIGQPFAGYALSAHIEKDIIIIGILIQKETFFQVFLPVLSADTKLFHFFLDPQTNEYSEEFIHLRFDDSCCIRTLLEMMIIEYANPQEDTQAILQPMVLTLLMMVARQYKRSSPVPKDERLSERIVRYMGEHSDVVTLKDISKHFSYHLSCSSIPRTKSNAGVCLFFVRVMVSPRKS